MMEQLFGNGVIEKILFYLLINEKSYGAQLGRVFDLPIFSVQTALTRLETGGIIVAQPVGKTRLYQFNPRYPFLKELQAFLKQAYRFIPKKERAAIYEVPIRQRPRKQGKPLS